MMNRRHGNMLLAITAMTVAVAMIAALAVWYVVVPHYERSHEPAAYRVVYSDMFDPNKGGVLAVDARGGIIADKRIPGLRDAAAYSYESGEFIAGGHRANTHLAIGRDGEVRSFHLLGEPRYSGVMSIEPHGDGVAAVMNGNDSPEDDSYLNLLVIQNDDGAVMERKVLKIYTEGQVTAGEDLFIAGHELTLSSNRYQGKIIRYGLADGSIQERVFDDDLLYGRPVVWRDRVLSVGSDMDGSPRQIDMFDMDTLARTDSLRVASDFQSLISVEGRPWMVRMSGICPLVEQPLGVGDRCIAMPGMGSSWYVSQTIAVGTRIVMLMRDSDDPVSRVPEHGVKQVGVIVDVDTATGDVSTTPVRIPRNRGSDSILITPAA